jgi:hypothetical protein
MNDIRALRDEIARVFRELKAGSIPPGTVKELNNAAGKIINTIKVELEYASLRKEKPQIRFLDP